MTILTITDKGINQPTSNALVKFNDPILREKMPPFNFETDDPVFVANALIDAVTKHKGLGLSANQIGLRKRCFVAGADGNYVAYFNPRVIDDTGDTWLYSEGCLSLPGIFLIVRRATNIICTYQDYLGKEHTTNFTGLTARILQHEADHLNGIMITNHASDIKLQAAMKKAKRNGFNYTLKDLKG